MEKQYFHDPKIYYLSIHLQLSLLDYATSLKENKAMKQINERKSKLMKENYKLKTKNYSYS